MKWIIWGIGAWGSLVIIVGAFMCWRSIRNSPRCPVHNKRMRWMGEDEYADEFACPVKGCRWCADVDPEGRVQIYEV